MLLEKCSDKAAEQADLQGKLSDLTAQLDANNAEAASVAAARASIVAEFDTLVHETHAFRDKLAHIFNRCVCACA